MDFQDAYLNLSFDVLRNQLDFNQIPGWLAQRRMAPPDRQRLVDQGRYNPTNPRIAAVLILIYEQNGRLKFPVIHRNTYPGVHSNQIGFPGGKLEKTDASLEAAAIRECQEEIGAEVDKIEVIGALSELFIPPSNFLVYPFVGLYHGKPDFAPCDWEVQQIISIDLNDVLQDDNFSHLTLTQNDQPYKVPAFELENGMKIWGATAMMLNEFYAFLQNSLHLSADQ